MINYCVNQLTKTVSGIQKESKTSFSLPPPPPFGAILSVWRISGSTIWIWRKPMRNKDPTGGLNMSWLRLLDWLTCSHKASSSWAWASGCRRPKPSTSISVTTWLITTAVLPVRDAARSARCVLCSTWTNCLTPNVLERDHEMQHQCESKWRIDKGFISGL